MKTLSIIFIMALMAISLPINAYYRPDMPTITAQPQERGIEVRYIKMQLAEGEILPKEIEVYGQKFPLFKTKEEAYEYVVAMPIKKDLVVVYVITEKDEVVEFVSLIE